MEYLRRRADHGAISHWQGFAVLEFESAHPSVVKSIKQRDLLNVWLRLYARAQSLPRLDEYQPSRIEDELPDLVFYSIETDLQPPRLTIQSNGTRMSSAYGTTGKGRYLDEYLGPRLAPIVMPVYYECIARRLPAYTIANIDDIYGRIVAYERLLLPFSDGDGNVTHIIASLKTISEDGGFEIKNLMRGNDKLPVLKLRAIIDRELFHRAPGRISSGDILEFG
ncbi:MAG: PAS domain-containing protein [Rhizobiales bacterium]|nr:PAS domain-containing protein [Hyphomicrobiales bacterium]